MLHTQHNTYSCKHLHTHICTHRHEITNIIIDTHTNTNTHTQNKIAYIKTYNTKFTMHTALRRTCLRSLRTKSYTCRAIVCKHTHAYRRARAHTHMQTHTHTHTHTHTLTQLIRMQGC